MSVVTRTCRSHRKGDIHMLRGGYSGSIQTIGANAEYRARISYQAQIGILPGNDALFGGCGTVYISSFYILM